MSYPINEVKLWCYENLFRSACSEVKTFQNNSGSVVKVLGYNKNGQLCKKYRRSVWPDTEVEKIITRQSPWLKLLGIQPRIIIKTIDHEHGDTVTIAKRPIIKIKNKESSRVDL